MMQLSLFGSDFSAEAEVLAPVLTSEPMLTVSSPFVHPMADSRIQLQGHEVAYRLRRAQRRSIGLTVGLDGLSVSVPRWASRRDIEAALQEKAAWIVRKILAQGERSRQLQAVELDWLHGAALPYLGRTLQVQRAERVQGLSEAEPSVLRLKFPPAAQPLDVQRAAVAWLKKQAIPLFAQRCDHFAPLLGVKPTQLALSSARTRWGSAHASGTIRLNWRLIHFALPVIDYVVAHELAHLREMNHSTRFWALVESVIPDMAAAQRTLRETVLPVWR